MICDARKLPPEIVKSDWDKAMAAANEYKKLFGKDFYEIKNDDTVQALDKKAGALYSKLMTWTTSYPKNKLALKWKERMLARKKRINSIMTAKKFNEIKKELPLEEGKLVSDFSSVLDKIMSDLKSKLGREYQKNSEKGIAMINTIGAMVGAKVTDKKQSKNRLFLKFDNDLEEKKDMTAISSWKKKIKKVKGLTKTQLQVLQNLPTPVITSLINQVGMVVAGDEPIQEDNYS